MRRGYPGEPRNPSRRIGGSTSHSKCLSGKIDGKGKLSNRRRSHNRTLVFAALMALDDWRQKQTNTPDRAEAICRLVRQLTLADVRPIAAESQSKATELASREIDKLGAKSVMAKNARNASDISSKGPLNSGKSAPDERRAKSRAGATALLAPAPYAPTPPRVRPN
jgi:hypothetical protein